MDVPQLFHELPVIPNIEIVVSLLPKVVLGAPFNLLLVEWGS
jgi:hypothetical protein